ncbi:Chromosomal replication initiator protein DnaA [Desulfovibrionales bacterium]
METLWSQIQSVLQKTIDSGSYQVWLKQLQAEPKDDGFLLIAPNEFVATWIRDRLLPDIEEAVTTVLGYRPGLQVTVRPQTGPLSVTATPGGTIQTALLPLSVGQTQCQLPLPVTGLDGPPQAFLWQFNFDDFVVGPCNELAYAAAKSLVQDTVSAEQLFVSSGPGLGKTHLLQAVGARYTSLCNKRRPRVEYLTAEEFARRMVMALRLKEIERFKVRYRDDVDILILEDVHFFQGKEKIQYELLATLKALHDHGAKVVLSSSFLPRELKDLDSQLISRFCSGFIAAIDRPDFETRKRIIECKARIFDIALPESVTELLADRIRADVRQLESCLKNLILKAKLLNKHISLDLAWEILGSFTASEPCLSFDRIIDFVCDTYELSREQLRSKSRQRQVVMGRNIVFFLARKHTDLSLEKIGNQFNRRHSTVLKGITNIERELTKKSPLGRQLARTMDLLKRWTQTLPA